MSRPNWRRRIRIRSSRLGSSNATRNTVPAGRSANNCGNPRSSIRSTIDWLAAPVHPGRILSALRPRDCAKTAGVWGQFCQRFPQDYAAAVAYLEAATDYSPPEVCKEAALNLLKHEPQSAYPDAWRRLMIAADRANDAALAKQALAWIQKATQKFGSDPTYASAIGDTLAKFQLETEAVAYWLQYLKHDRHHGESRECGARLLARLKEPAKRRVDRRSPANEHRLSRSLRDVACRRRLPGERLGDL